MNSDQRRLPRIPGRPTAQAAAPAPVTTTPPPSPPQPATIPLPPTSAAAAVDDGPQEVPIGEGLNQYLADKNSLAKEELVGLRDALIQVLAMLSGDIATRPDNAPSAAAAVPQLSVSEAVQAGTSEATDRIASMMVGNEGNNGDGADVDREAKMALSLLLKHRGGPGFGHGRLTGKELGLLETKLRSVADMMSNEAV